MNWITRAFVLAAFACVSVHPAAGQAPAPGADPRINSQFVRPDVPLWTARFEGESREIYARRDAIVAASGVTAGMTVADLGAGTGFFAMLFARLVGPRGRAIAADVSRPFLDAIEKRAAGEGLGNVTTVLATQADTGLAAASVDVVFTSDTYHHFEQTGPVLASIHRALKPGGRFIVIDYERIPGVTPQRTLDHVRAGKETVTAEVVAAGFRLREEIRTVGLSENYFLVFERP
jgi:predicted methyltransferase